jgi:hypothetical protein
MSGTDEKTLLPHAFRLLPKGNVDFKLLEGTKEGYEEAISQLGKNMKKEVT